MATWKVVDMERNTTALQEAIAKIEALEARVATLESA